MSMIVILMLGLHFSFRFIWCLTVYTAAIDESPQLLLAKTETKVKVVVTDEMLVNFKKYNM